jgi:hypothetical protein
MALLPKAQPLKLVPQIRFTAFFDRPGVAAKLSKAKKKALWKAGSAVMQIARRSIRKVGNAKPQLAVMKRSPGLSVAQLLTSSAISKKDRRQLEKRLMEIRKRDGSPAGSPPFTHTGAMRNSIGYDYDDGSESVVIGGHMPGINHILALHEFGGHQSLQAFAYVPPAGKGNPGLIGWWPVGKNPRSENWSPLGSRWRKAAPYPARPYMNPAMLQAIRRKRVQEAFRACVSPG